MLLPPHAHLSYFDANTSVASPATATHGTLLTSGAANTAGTWTQIHAGLTYPTAFLVVSIAGVRTSADVISATTLNAYIDIGIGPDNANVTTIIEKLSGSQAQGLGHVYFLPIRVPPDTPVWARHQNTAASAKSYIRVSWFGGNGNPGTLPSFPKLVALGATAASTTGTTITPGASSAEGAWTQIVASTASGYAGVMLSPLFNVDTTMTSALHNVGDVGVGSAGNELTIGENIMQSFIWSTAEQRDAICLPSFVGIPAGSRISARVSGSATADSTNSVIVYAFTH